jgi:hypothetical protein
MGYVRQSPQAIVGDWAEHEVAGRAMHHGWYVLHTSEIGEGATMVEGRDGKVVMPDLQLFDLINGRRSRLVQVKAKRGAYRYMKQQIDCTGMDWPDYEACCRINRSGVPVDLALVPLYWPLRSSPEIAPKLLWQTVDALGEPMRFEAEAFPRGAAVWDVAAFDVLGDMPNPPERIVAEVQALGARMRVWEKPPSLRRPRQRPAQYDLFAWGLG